MHIKIKYDTYQYQLIIIEKSQYKPKTCYFVIITVTISDMQTIIDHIKYNFAYGCQNDWLKCIISHVINYL